MLVQKVSYCTSDAEDVGGDITDAARREANEAFTRGVGNVAEDIAAAADAIGLNDGVREEKFVCVLYDNHSRFLRRQELRPSFQLMTNFVLFMARQFAMVEAYPLLDHKLLVNLEDMVGHDALE